jgi:predicted nucleic acid-binding protein
MFVDTAIFIDYLKGNEAAAIAVVQARAAGPGRRVSMHAVVAAELITGVLNRSELRRATALISTCRVIVPDESDIRRALRLLEKHVLSDGLEWNDCLIAATAMRLDQPVLTPNEKHFRVFKGLEVVRPY